MILIGRRVIVTIVVAISIVRIHVRINDFVIATGVDTMISTIVAIVIAGVVLPIIVGKWIEQSAYGRASDFACCVQGWFKRIVSHLYFA
jgi:hypothetical protein